MLLVLPNAPKLNLALEKAVIEEALKPLRSAVELHGPRRTVTRTVLSDALMAAPYDILHYSGHATFKDGQGSSASTVQTDKRTGWKGKHFRACWPSPFTEAGGAECLQYGPGRPSRSLFVHGTTTGARGDPGRGCHAISPIG